MFYKFTHFMISSIMNLHYLSKRRRDLRYHNSFSELQCKNALNGNNNPPYSTRNKNELKDSEKTSKHMSAFGSNKAGLLYQGKRY